LIFTNGYLRISNEDLYGITAGGCGACLVWLKRSGSGDPWQNLGGIFSGTLDNGLFLSKFPFDSFSEFAIGSTEDITTSTPQYMEHKPNTLAQNYPNPFKQSTKIKYEIGSRQLVILKVSDLSGKEIRTLVNEEQPAGSYEIDFDGSNMVSGTYIIELQAGLRRETKKMILMK